MNLKRFFYSIFPKYKTITTKYCTLDETKELIEENKKKPSILKWSVESYSIEEGEIIVKMKRKQRIYE